MFFPELFTEDSDSAGIDASPVDALIPPDPDTAEGEDAMANQVELIMRTQAMESATFFEGGEDAIDIYNQWVNEQQMLHEGIISAAAKNNNIVRLNTRDDLKRRTNLAALMLAKSRHDPLFNKLALNRVKERKLRAAIYKKYQRQAFKIARMSQRKHVVDAKKVPVPSFKKDTTGNRTSMSAVLK